MEPGIESTWIIRSCRKEIVQKIKPVPQHDDVRRQLDVAGSLTLLFEIAITEFTKLIEEHDADLGGNIGKWLPALLQQLSVIRQDGRI